MGKQNVDIFEKGIPKRCASKFKDQEVEEGLTILKNVKQNNVVGMK